ncbi:putative B3 domain-containing protein At2g27410 [Abrus precatorius]|uniref:B3 domain-containing protein At2g27410 n=1 Tax=Abrus precatorius TaxID=3816 RepID=A0A8B8LUR8_ABRPR|nr:putative B3 domain-containing protein At2g27410 [Abrus precatorius]
MKDIKVLKELVANISDSETRQKMSHKPFTPSFLDVIISQDSPQLYNEEEMIQVMKLYKFLPRVRTRSETVNTKKTTKKRCRKNEDVAEEKRVTKKPKDTIIPHHGPSPNLPENFKNGIIELNGYDIKFLMHKKLFLSDLSSNSNRLSMPLTEFMCDFLTEDEKSTLGEREGRKGRIRGLEVTVLDPCLREFTLLLKKWTMKTTSIYNLVKNWKDVVSVNKLKEDDELQIWSFRVQSKLYFLLNKL